MNREYTLKLLDMMENGAINPQTVAVMCLCWMSEADVQDLCRSNDLLIQDEDEDSPFDDGTIKF
jgi:hypothetical protein